MNRNATDGNKGSSRRAPGRGGALAALNHEVVPQSCAHPSLEALLGSRCAAEGGEGAAPPWRLAILGIIFAFLTLSASAAIKQELPELRPPRDELPPPVSKTSTVLPWIVTAGIAAILIVTFGWSRPPKVHVPESPGTRARRDLQKAAPPQAVAQILRHFLLVYFPLPGEGASTEEISESLYANLPSDPTLAHQVTEFLLACDTEKFAPASVAPGAVAAAAAAGWAPKDAGASSAPTGAPAATGAAEVAASFIDKIEKRRHRRAPERSL